jgi:Family of unknown function (DUF6941)
MAPDESELVPLPLAMVVCDTIWVESVSQKASLLGVVNQIGAPSYPTEVNLAVFASVTAVRGKVELRLLLVDVNQERPPITEGSIEIEADDPTTEFDIDFDLGSVSLPEPGMYLVQLFAGSRFVCERRISANLTPGGAG